MVLAIIVQRPCKTPEADEMPAETLEEARNGGLDDAVVVALGGNLDTEDGESSAVLTSALDGFGGIGLIVKAKSSIWRSRSWPDPSQPDYLNAVVLVQTDQTPEALLQSLHGLEARFGRRRSAPNAPRTLDLDLIAYGRRLIERTELVVPHPRAAERLFVMGPLAEIAPNWRHPRSLVQARTLADTATVGRDARPVLAFNTTLHNCPLHPM